MSLDSLQQRLAALEESTSQLRELISRLANIAFPPGTAPSAIDEEGTPSAELSGEISGLMRSGMEEQQILVEEVKFVREEGGRKTALREGITRLGGELSSCRSELRRARLCAKQRLEKAQRMERELAVQALVEQAPSTTTTTTTATATTTSTSTSTAIPRPTLPASRPQQQQHRSGLPDKDRHTVSASSSLTSALQRTHALMTAELTRSEFAHQMLSESSDALARLDESYLSLDGMLSRSRDLLAALLRSQKSDTWYLQTARGLLLATLAWLVFRRVLYGPLWWFVWLPLRVVVGVGVGAGRAVMQAGGEGGMRERLEEAGGGARSTVEVEGLPDESLPTVRVAEEAGEAVVVDGLGKEGLEGMVEVNMTGEGMLEGEEEPGDEAREAPRDEL